ncbi:MAG: RNA-binding S4 domain-containing protein [Cyanobacteria bacterium P01_A01_bin.135]
MVLKQQPIKLGQFLKIRQVVQTGGQAKMLVQSGEVMVNGVVETQRGRKLFPGDRVEVFDSAYRVGDE